MPSLRRSGVRSAWTSWRRKSFLPRIWNHRVGKRNRARLRANKIALQQVENLRHLNTKLRQAVQQSADDDRELRVVRLEVREAALQRMFGAARRFRASAAAQRS